MKRRLPDESFDGCLLMGTTALADASLPTNSAYVQVKSGHLTLDGQRQRYWAAIGQVYVSPDLKPHDTPEQRALKIGQAKKGTDILVQRFQDLGFNAVRLWATAPNQENYTPGDGSNADSVDYFVAQMKNAGFKIWTAGLNEVGKALPADADIIDDAPTAEAWKTAVGEKGIEIRGALARIWDPRLEAIGIRNMKAVATHFNKHTGLRWCDAPTFIVWELSNEDWWHSGSGICCGRRHFDFCSLPTSPIRTEDKPDGMLLAL